MKMIIFKNRQQELAINIVLYLCDWMDDNAENTAFRNSIDIIEDSYCCSFNEADDSLVKSAIRYYRQIVNPWNDNNMINTLNEQCNFSTDEAIFYCSTIYN